MITLPALFVIVYVACIIVFLLLPKKAFLTIIKRDMDKDFNPNNFRTINTYAKGYYSIIVLGAGICAALITFLLKLIFY